MNLIEKLGLEKCKAIVDGAPDARYFGCSIDTAKYWVNQGNEYHSNPVFFPNMSRQVAYVLDDLRTAIADHDRTDHCSDITNHISHLTEMREEFEKLHEIKIRLVAVFFNPKEKKYVSKNHLLSSCSEFAKFINGSWLVWQHQQAKINQHQLEIHALGEANLNQAMMLAKKQEEIDSLKAQLNNMEQCYIGKKKQADACAALVSGWREKPMGGWSDYARGGLHSRQDCADDLEKALRGEHE